MAVWNSKTGALLLYGLQTAVSNLKHMPEVDPDDMVTEDANREDRQDTGNPEAVVAAEKAAAAASVRSTWQQLAARHHIPSRPSGNTAQDARFAETLAEYYNYDPDDLLRGAGAPARVAVTTGISPPSGDGARATDEHTSLRNEDDRGGVVAAIEASTDFAFEPKKAGPRVNFSQRHVNSRHKRNIGSRFPLASDASGNGFRNADPG